MADTNLYKHYIPSLGASVTFTVIFGILILAHSILIIRTKRKFPITIVFGGLCKPFNLGI